MTGLNPLYFMVGMAIVGLGPFLLMMTTSYVKIIVVTSLIRNAPTFKQTYDVATSYTYSENMEPQEIIAIAEPASVPLKTFLDKNTDPQILHAFVSTAR